MYCCQEVALHPQDYHHGVPLLLLFTNIWKSGVLAQVLPLWRGFYKFWGIFVIICSFQVLHEDPGCVSMLGCCCNVLLFAPEAIQPQFMARNQAAIGERFEHCTLGDRQMASLGNLLRDRSVRVFMILSSTTSVIDLVKKALSPRNTTSFTCFYSLATYSGSDF